MCSASARERGPTDARQLEGCDLGVADEGRIDDQTLHDGLPAVVARRAAPLPVTAVVVRGDPGDDARRPTGLRAVHTIADRTDGDPANDPGPSARLLDKLDRTVPVSP